MQTDRIIEILSSWNFWSKDIDVGIKRADYVAKLSLLAATEQIVVITGVRRSGKSVLMRQFIKQLLEKGVNRNATLYINFEEPKFFGELSLEFLNNIYDAYLEIMKPEQKPYIFLDEVQHIYGWEKFVRALHEKKEAYIFISGSSAKMLSKEFSTVLTGRKVQLMVYPLNFKEFLLFKNIELKDKLDILSNKIKIKQSLREYSEYGSLPLVVLMQEKEEILRNCFEDIVTKDVVERHKIKKVEKLKILAKFYLTNFSSLISYRKIKKFIGLSLDTVERFSYYLTEPYLLYFVNKFSFSLKEQEVNPRKVYSIDIGLANIVGFKFMENMGKIYENIVFIHLMHKNEEIYYWNKKGECDFILKKGKKIYKAIQVCYSLNNETREREINGICEALSEFKLKEGIIITEDYDAEEKINGKKIKYIPLWKWLLLSVTFKW